MYLEHFQLKEQPFSLTPNTDFFCKLRGHQEAINTVMFALRSGDGFIKVTGEVGIGKTLLCRELLNTIEKECKDFVTCYIPNPDDNPLGLFKALAYELGIKDTLNSLDQHEIMKKIQECLVGFCQKKKKVILIVDEAQVLSNASLETLRLLTNLETASKKLLHIVLFAQPELDARLKNPELRQLMQRITFSYRVPTISDHDLDLYLCHRLVAAGHGNGLLFTEQAKRLLLRYSMGIPRIINILCHKALLFSYGQGMLRVDAKSIKESVADSQDIIRTCRHHTTQNFYSNKFNLTGSMGLLFTIILGIIYFVLAR
jgi:MSHA biogenesis protein MshM